MTFNKITLTIDDAVAVLTLNDPDTLNSVSVEMLDELDAAFSLLEGAECGARCLVLTGAGRGFCSGANLTNREVLTDEHGETDVGQVLERYYHPLLKRMRALPMPLVTAVNGAAAGIGMSFALMGDMILAARDAYFLQAFSRIALVPDGGSTWLLPRLVGLARAKELSLLAEKLPAETALQWGMINRVYDNEALMPEALALARKLAQGPTRAYTLIRRLYAASTDNDYETQLELERRSQKEAGQCQDFEEGVTAFFERRPPVFEGR